MPATSYDIYFKCIVITMLLLLLFMLAVQIVQLFLLHLQTVLVKHFSQDSTDVIVCNCAVVIVM